MARFGPKWKSRVGASEASGARALGTEGGASEASGAHSAGMAGSPLLALLMRDLACAWARTEIASGAHPAVAASLKLKEQTLRAERAERAQPTSGHGGQSEQSEQSPPRMANAALLVEHFFAEEHRTLKQIQPPAS